MAEYINREDLKFLEIPIAPVLQGEQVHYEQGFLKEWLESVPTADVIERSKIDKAIEEIKQVSFKHRFELGEYIGEETVTWEVVKLDHVLNILKRNIEE